MSSWGPRSFEDDFACDWLEDLHESDPFAFFSHCLDLSDQEDLNFLACVGVRCTCEMIVGILDKPRLGFPENALAWIETNRVLGAELTALISASIHALARVNQTGSAMQLKWQDAGPVHYEVWHDELKELQKHLAELTPLT